MNKERNEMSIKLNEPAKEFLIYSYFGISPKDLENKDKIITICAQRAYLDLSRTLRFKDDYKENSKNDNKQAKKEKVDKRINFKNDISKLIEAEVLSLIKSDDFDSTHNELCDRIMIESKSEIEGGMKYGQAQKWLNMTIKYMWLLGMWESDFEKNIKVIHIPVDSYIIEAVWEYESVDLPLKEKSKRKGEYTNPSEHVEAWSRWEKEEYISFQNSLREQLSSDRTNPIEWEGRAWINVAKKKRNSK